MAVTLLYFAWLRDAIGVGEEQIDHIPDALLSPSDVTAWLAQRGGGYGTAFADPSRLRCAVNQQLVAMDAPLMDVREIAFFPPVTGG